MAPQQGMYTIAFGFRREKGPVRQENQDQMVNFQSSVYGQAFLIADGMGGHEGGAIAANMAITGFRRHFLEASKRLPLHESLTEAARLTNLDIWDKSSENGAGALRMGSTLVLCMIAGNVYTVANVGDSRCYCFRAGALARLTRDHTAVQKMIDTGVLSPEEARDHPEASVLTRAFGQRPEIEMDVYPARALAPDEALLLCSDGLYAFVGEDAIADRLTHNADPQAAADALMQLALDAGGHDNISIFVIRVAEPQERAATAPDPPEEAEAGENPAAIETPAAVAPEPEPAAFAPSDSASPDAAQISVAVNLAVNKGRSGAAVLLLALAAIAIAGVLVFLHPELLPPSARGALHSWGIGVNNR